MSMKINYQTGTSTSNNTNDTNLFTGSKAIAQVTVTNWENLSSEVLTVNGTALTQGVEWSATISNKNTATLLKNAINANVANVTASIDFADSGTIYMSVDTPGTAGNSYTLVTTDNLYLPISGSTFRGGYDAVAADELGTNSYKFGSSCVIDSTSDKCMIISSGENNTIIGGDYSSIICSTNCIVTGPGLNIYLNSIINSDSSSIVDGAGICTILGGDLHKIIADDYALIIGGYKSIIEGNGTYNSIINSSTCTISNGCYLSTIIGSENSSINTGDSYIGIYSVLHGIISGGSGYCSIIGGENQNITNGDYYSIISGGSDNEIHSTAGYSGLFASYNVWLDDFYGSCAINVENGYIKAEDVLCFGYWVATEQASAFIQASSQSTKKHQTSRVVQRGESTTASPTALTFPIKISRFLGNGLQGSISSIAFTVEMNAIQRAGTAGTIGDSCFKKYEFLVKNISGTCTQVGSITTTTIAYDTAASGWGLTFTIDDINDEIDVTFTGETDKTIAITSVVNIVETAV